jgi:hypothetical protein
MELIIQQPTNLKIGPKNRLLKGDVLSFLDDPSLSTQGFHPIPHAYYSTDLSLDVSLPLRSGLGVNATNSMGTSKDLNILYHKATATGESTSVLKSVQDLPSAKKLARIAQSSSLLTPREARLTIMDYSQQVDALDTIEEPYLQPHESGILLIQPTTSFKSVKEADILDILSGKVHTSSSSQVSLVHEKSGNDLLDLLASSSAGHPIASHVSVELIVDARAVQSKTANAFLERFKELVTKEVKTLF